MRVIGHHRPGGRDWFSLPSERVVTRLGRTEEVATGTMVQGDVEIILDAGDLRILGGRGGASVSAWQVVLGGPLTQILADGADAADLAELTREPGQVHQRSVDLSVDEVEFGLVATIERIGECVLIRGTLRHESADVVTEAQLVQHRLEELGVVVSGVAHDFNNILSAILGNAEFLSDALAEFTSTDHDLAAAVEDIMTAADRSRELIAQMLGYAEKKRSGELSALDITVMTAEMARLLRASIPPRISLHFVPHDQVPLVVGNASQLRQVIMNLIVNAADAISEAGTITIRSGTMYADPTLLASGFASERAVEGDYVFTEFEDTGCGMSAATIRRIFDPFFTTKSTGRGLGLAGVRSIVSQHGGCLLVTSTPGVGSIFRVLVPVSAATSRIDSGVFDASKLSLRGRQILVVDDEPMILRVSRRVLTARGARVVVAADGHQGIELFAADVDAFECAVLDVAMPFIDGIEVAHELRALRDDLPILFISGYGREEIERRVADLERVALLEKPFASTRLVAAIHALIGDNARITPLA